MTVDRISALHVAGLRTLRDIRLQLDGLTVLIGPNSSGKSSILEAFEILRRAPGPEFLKEFNRIHGGLPALLRIGEQALTLGVRIGGAGPPVEYELTIGRQESGAAIIGERVRFSLFFEETSIHEIRREDDAIFYGEERLGGKVSRHQLALSGFDSLVSADAAEYLMQTSEDHFRKQIFEAKEGLRKEDAGRLLYEAARDIAQRNPERVSDAATLVMAPFIVSASRALARVRVALGQIRVHLPFEVTAAWLARSQRRSSVLRETSMLEPTEDLEPLGANLANAFATLKNEYGEDHWQETLGYVRAGLGEDVETITTRPDPGGGAIALRLKFRGLDAQLPAQALSDGTLAYLAFVAIYRLRAERALLCFDEPEQYLHPSLLGQIMGMLQALSDQHPVLIATHSDRLLDALADPARSVVLCALDQQRETRLLRPDPEALDRWLTDYRGLGDLRGAGHEDLIMTRPER